MASGTLPRPEFEEKRTSLSSTGWQTQKGCSHTMQLVCSLSFYPG